MPNIDHEKLIKASETTRCSLLLMDQLQANAPNKREKVSEIISKLRKLVGKERECLYKPLLDMVMATLWDDV